jgi:hypothetical protein
MLKQRQQCARLPLLVQELQRLAQQLLVVVPEGEPIGELRRVALGSARRRLRLHPIADGAPVGVRLVGRLKRLGVLAHDFQQVELGRVAVGQAHRQPCAEQRLQRVGDGFQRRVGVKHRVQRRQRPRAWRRGELAQQRLRGSRQRRVGDIQHAAHLAMARRDVHAVRLEPLQPMRDRVEHLARAKHIHARGCQLDCQRHAVQPSAQRADDRQVLLRDAEIVRNLSRPMHEQLHGGAGERVVAGQRRERDQRLAVDADGRAGGTQQAAFGRVL